MRKRPIPGPKDLRCPHCDGTGKAAPQTLGQRIADARIVREWSQDTLSEKSGVPATTIQNIETGKATASWQAMTALAETLCLSLDYIATGKEAK